jgi:hypothetical protein
VWKPGPSSTRIMYRRGAPEWDTDQLLVTPLRLQREQLTADRHYLTITRDQADRVLQSIETMAEVRSGRWERWVTIFLGAFTVLGIAQVFPEVPLIWRGGIVVVVSGLVPLLLWRMSPRE